MTKQTFHHFNDSIHYFTANNRNQRKLKNRFQDHKNVNGNQMGYQYDTNTVDSDLTSGHIPPTHPKIAAKTAEDYKIHSERRNF